MMGYELKLYAMHQIKSAEAKWRERVSRELMPVKEHEDFRIFSSNILVLWQLVKICNMLFNKYLKHECLTIPQHLAEAHGINALPDTMTILEMGIGIEKRLKMREEC